jgi:hypothetical protein
MSHIIGRGRYARETYPRRSRGGGAIIQCGYDQVVGSPEESITVPPSLTAVFPRDVTGAPLRVTLPNVTPGNFLEVDFRACMEKEEAYYADQAEFNSIAVVRFDGAPPDLPPTPGTFGIMDSSTGHRDITNTEEGEQQPVFNVTNLVGVIIPPLAVTAIVQIFYEATSAFDVDPALNEATFATLKVCELAAGAIYQPGPGTLVPLDEE